VTFVVKAVIERWRYIASREEARAYKGGVKWREDEEYETRHG
jgi:hypothetical protein